ncbi:hypothetical protein F5Y03DRAFT_378894 [Xylaria venustula]|nr:hypothetical protein F5Y03DRAFT_378894 [Xylaria venustula]
MRQRMAENKDIRSQPRHHGLPSLSLQHGCEKLDYNNESLTSEVFGTFEEQETAMDMFCAKAKQFDAAEIDGKQPNENKIYREHAKTIIGLNFVNIKLMTLCSTADFELSALDFAKSVMARYNKLCAASNPANNLPRMSAEKLQAFDNEIESLQTATRWRQTIRASAQQRAEQMVALLRASNAQRDTVYNQKISENSRIASSLAKNLTMLGSLFIPASFIAALFGTNIFDVNAQTGHLDIHDSWWILAASAGGLTVLVIAIMVWMWVKQMPGNLKSRCPLSSSGRDTTKPAYTQMKQVIVVPHDTSSLASGSELISNYNS